ncbi:MAG: LysR family transcriptional regulator [Pseudorhodoplanes sp.]|uniref:LysR family transcriptional regulator n=1 Tax=Pseudorhodoplanes sp. TaxID=1934341 RepID=UPI003D0C6856
MNLRQLRYFLSVVETGNMTRAAEQLHVAQTALGMQIRQLEESLGVALLVRHSRGVEPTRAGTLLRERAIEILKLVEQTRQEISADSNPETESIRLGITPALMLIVGTEIAMTARERLRGVSLSLVEAMSHVLADTLTRGETDFILCYDVPELPHIARVPILQDDLVLVTLPGEEPRKPITFADLLALDLAMPEEGDTVRTAVAKAAREMKRELRIAYEVRSISAMKSLVGRGAASAVLPYFAVIDEVRDGRLDARQITEPSIRRTLYLATSSQRGPFQNADGLASAIRGSLAIVTDALGPLAHPL